MNLTADEQAKQDAVSARIAAKQAMKKAGLPVYASASSGLSSSSHRLRLSSKLPLDATQHVILQLDGANAATARSNADDWDSISSGPAGSGRRALGTGASGRGALASPRRADLDARIRNIQARLNGTGARAPTTVLASVRVRLELELADIPNWLTHADTREEKIELKQKFESARIRHQGVIQLIEQNKKTDAANARACKELLIKIVAASRQRLDQIQKAHGF